MTSTPYSTEKLTVTVKPNAEIVWPVVKERKPCQS
jgi:hypothetical protein